MLSKEIWVFAEYREDDLSPATLGMLGEARKLAGTLNGKVCACILGSKIKDSIPLLGNGGAEKVYFTDSEVFSEYSMDVCAGVLQRLIAEYRPLMIIFDASSSGSELAARISLKTGLPFISEVKRIDPEQDNLVISKSCYEDKVYQNVTLGPEKTAILTILPSDTDSDEGTASGEVEVVEAEAGCEAGGARSRLIKFLKGDPKKISLEEADIIVAGGKGIGKEASGMEELADLMGASVGGTRPLVDEDVIPFERQIGITGKSVSPRLLLALGISGAREFTAGTEKTKLTIAVNTDDKAPIFKNADMKVHGDLKEIIPALVNGIRQRKEHS